MIPIYRDQIEQFLGRAAIADAKVHARAEFPKESCGYIANYNGTYLYQRCANAHDTPETDFRIDDPDFKADLISGRVIAVVHSHPNNDPRPSEMDMQQQIAMDLPWGIIAIGEEGEGEFVAWGDQLPVCPLISRPFLHGILDCYSIIRDTYRLGKDELLKQGIYWPLDPIFLPEFPRQRNWWMEEAEDLYVANFAKAGFRVITRAEARAGDVFLMKIGGHNENPHKKINHGGVLLQHDQVLQQFAFRISSRTPAGQWTRSADLWLRYGAA